MSAISTLLKQENITLTKISKQFNIPRKVIQRALKQKPDAWSPKVLNAFATSLSKTPGELIALLLPDTYVLEINDPNQTIQDVYIEDKETYQQIRFIVESEHLEGWEPTRTEIEFLLNQALEPNLDLQNEIDQIWSADHD
ncbi:helix-turn-helix transcriptional regulator [Lactobacillus sp. PV037]|uniref:helix-turn-helix domain-containing protein n=1 Tax=unclassified Lactobacillus TaxID=2620435 RepID=UPI0022405F2F|nr:MULTISPECIES: helix-turn-helix transcriptional regulator [unclassified Lactobacillus]QNQ82069.1 helix-turn-helix transcriptional regulator [Lactobacillus sp. PV012]QNQ83896.1 helix-turn-helix transcriptional regulator [Lactobacillus sp. PV037]